VLQLVNEWEFECRCRRAHELLATATGTPVYAQDFEAGRSTARIVQARPKSESPSGVQSRAALQVGRSPLKEKMLVSTRLEPRGKQNSRRPGMLYMIPSWDGSARCDRIPSWPRGKSTRMGRDKAFVELRRPDFGLARALDARALRYYPNVCIVELKGKVAAVRAGSER